MTSRLLLTLILTLAGAFVFLAPGDCHAQLSARDAYNKGLQLYKAQNYEEALKMFEAVQRAKPSDPYARSYISKCKTAIAQNLGSKNNLEANLAKIVVPQINFKDAPIGDVLDYLTSRAHELSGGKIVANFIYKGTAEQRQQTLISLNLRNVPMTEAIKYVGQLSRTRFLYEEHAIIADPNYKPPTTPALDSAGTANKKPTLFGEPVEQKTIFD